LIAIIGIVVVIGAILFGYLEEGGKLLLLLQPAEFVIIGGAGIGGLLIGTPKPVLSRIFKGLKDAFKGKSYEKIYEDLLFVLFELSSLTRSQGILAMEEHVENPKSSAILAHIKTQNKLMRFLCDSVRLVILGLSVNELDVLLSNDLESQEQSSHHPGGALTKLGDSLPGLGIVAAVLGIVITMSSIGGEAATVGKKVATALVGTFLGVLLSYGFVQPLASNVGSQNENEYRLMLVAKEGILALANGSNPIIVCEFARRCMPDDERPDFVEMEHMLKKERPK